MGLVEMLMGLTLGMVAVLTAVLALRASTRAVRVREEAVDVTERLRAVAAKVGGSLARAGSGYATPTPTGWVSAAAPRVVPARFAVKTLDSEHTAFADRITVLAAHDEPRSATLEVPMGATDAVLTIAPLPGCSTSPTCDLDVGDLVLVADRLGHADLVRITAVSGNQVAHAPAVLSHAYDPADDVRVVPLEARAYVFDPGLAQLREYRGHSAALVVADDIVGFAIRYYGTPAPPSGREFLAGSDTCLTTPDGGAKLADLALDHTVLVELPPAQLSDGPFCGQAPFRFDADVLRIRLIRLSLRAQASDPAVRGHAPSLFLHAGWALDPGAEVPDQEVTLDVALRNVLTVG